MLTDQKATWHLIRSQDLGGQEATSDQPYRCSTAAWPGYPERVGFPGTEMQ